LTTKPAAQTHSASDGRLLVFRAVKVSEILRMLQVGGWMLVATRGSHRQFKHANKPGRVTVPGKPGDDLAPGTLNSILKQSGLKK
jgi:predicted RNA binding protein YcfA (HicA-like mRNA interferase family)